MNNNQDRFIVYYDENKNKLLSYLMYRLNFDRDVAEDLLMDIVLKAYENFDSYDGEKGSFKNWLFTIAHNHLVNYWREQKKHEEVPLDAVEGHPITSIENTMDKEVDDQIRKQEVQDVLSLMNESEAEVILLRYIHDFSTQEIAQILGKKEGAVRTALCRGLNQFRSLYQKLYPSSS